MTKALPSSIFYQGPQSERVGVGFTDGVKIHFDPQTFGRGWATIGWITIVHPKRGVTVFNCVNLTLSTNDRGLSAKKFARYWEAARDYIDEVFDAVPRDRRDFYIWAWLVSKSRSNELEGLKNYKKERDDD